jgi:hypothetical protein
MLLAIYKEMPSKHFKIEHAKHILKELGFYQSCKANGIKSELPEWLKG